MNKKVIQLFLLLIPVAIFIWLLVIDICPSGIKTAYLEMGDSSPYIYSILPSDRVSDIQENQNGDKYVSILNEPTYFNVSLPNTDFDKIEVSLEFNSSQQPIIELGALADIYSENYNLEPILNTAIDNLGWTSIDDNGVSLFERELKFSSVDEFMENLPDRSSIGVYQYDLDVPYREVGYTSLTQSKTIDVSLRGYHKYLTYIKNEQFYLEVDYMDMNRTTGADDAVVRVRDENDDIVFEYFIDDDGDIIEDQVSSKGTAIINQSGWDEGVYSVELSGTSDIFWRSITTKQKYMAFVGEIDIGDDVGFLPSPRATSFYTDAKHITFETSHSDSTQSVSIGSEMIGVSQSHEKYKYTVKDPGLVYGYSSLGDIKINGDGKFAFNKEMYFNPDPVQLNVYSDVDALGIDYVLTSYNPQSTGGGWKVGKAIFEIDDMAKIDDSIKFTISTPGLIEFDGRVNIHSITVKFIKDPMTFGETLSAIRDLLPFGL